MSVKSIGRAFRINDLSITGKRYILCIHDSYSEKFCAKLEKEFLRSYPFGYLGTSPWIGAKTSDTFFSLNDPVNLEITEMMLTQADFNLVIYCLSDDNHSISEIKEYFLFVKNMLPESKHAVININGESASAVNAGREAGFQIHEYSSENEAMEIVGFSKGFIDEAGEPSFFDSQNRENVEWNNFSFCEPLSEINNRVLLVGDSISFGYGEIIRQKCKDLLVDIFNTSEGTAHANIYTFLKFMFTKYKYKVIHINIGIHVHGVSVTEYSENLGRIFDYIKAVSPETTIVFATTTPVSRKPDIADITNKKLDINNFNLGGKTPVKLSIKQKDQYSVIDLEATKKYIEFNEAANYICRERNIDIDDLFKVCVENSPPYSDTVHLKAEGYELLANSVSKYLYRNLEKAFL